MATIRKRGDKWQVQVRRKGARPVSKSFLTRKDAEVWSRQCEAAIDLGRPIEATPSNYKLGDLLDRYQREITDEKKGKEVETRRINRLKRDPLAKLPLSSLDAPTLSQFRDRRIKDGIRACQYDLVLIRHAIEIGRKEWGLPLASNPVDQIRVPNGIRARNRRLEKGEYEKLRSAAEFSRSPWIWPATNLALETAMRRSELLRLEWSDVDFSERLAHLHDTKNGRPRAVPLTSRAIRTLESLPRPSAKVLPTTDCALRQSWERLVARAGIKDLRFHDLRHEAVSRMFEVGLNVAEVSLVSGHRDPRMLFRYTHLKAENVVERMSQRGL